MQEYNDHVRKFLIKPAPNLAGDKNNFEEMFVRCIMCGKFTDKKDVLTLQNQVAHMPIRFCCNECKISGNIHSEIYEKEIYNLFAKMHETADENRKVNGKLIEKKK